MEVKDKSLTAFEGALNEFSNEKLIRINAQLETNGQREKKEKLLILENKLSEIISTISIEKDINKKESLNAEYLKLLKNIKELKQ